MKFKYLLTILISVIFVFGFMVYAKASTYDSPASMYKDNYIVSGWEEDTQVKFNVSVRYRVVYKAGLFMGYTQLSKWDLYSKSSPFKENNYQPEVFYKFESDNNEFDINLGVIDYIQISPIYHRSNGRDGVESRGENLYYGQAQISIGKVHNFGINGKLYNYYNVSSKNKDINDYHKNYEIDVFYKYKSSTVEELDKEEVHVRFSGNPLDKGFVEGTLKFRIWTSAIQLRLYGQVFHGYDEFIIDYNKKDTAARVGFCF